jgi:hypothetical protein
MVIRQTTMAAAALIIAEIIVSLRPPSLILRIRQASDEGVLFLGDLAGSYEDSDVLVSV